MSYFRMDTGTLFRVKKVSERSSDFQRTKGLQK